jgi:hypothetical protein
MILGPVDELDSCSRDVCGFVPGISTGMVVQKLDECLKKAGEASDQKRTGSGPDADTREQ